MYWKCFCLQLISAVIWSKLNTHCMLQFHLPYIYIYKYELLNRMEMCIFFLFCLNIIYIFLFSTALQKLQKIVTCFPEDKLFSIYPDLQIQKVFTPRLLMHVFFPYGASGRVWIFCNSCKWVPQLKRWISKSCSHRRKGFKYTKMLEKQRICGTWRIFFWRTAGILTVQDKQGTNEQLSLNKKNSVKKKETCGSFR